MTNTDNQNDQAVVVNLIDHTIITASNPKCSCRLSPYRKRARRTRIAGQKFYHRLDPPTALGIELPQSPHPRRRNLNVVGHLSPRSALTCSQGIAAAPAAIS